jgi:hypothetical protein
MPREDPHTVIQRLIVETAKYLGLFGETEWEIDNYRVDAVWKKFPDSCPFCVFEIELSNNISAAINRLKAAWLKYSNPSLYLIVKQWELQKAVDILRNSLPEMLDKIKLFSVDDFVLYCKIYKDFDETNDKFFPPFKPNLVFRRRELLK